MSSGSVGVGAAVPIMDNPLSFILLHHQTKHTIDRYFALTRQAEGARDADNAAALRIQRLWRGYTDRQYLIRLHRQATDIQRRWRGYRGRRRFADFRRKQNLAMDSAMYNAAATMIQKIVRGFVSRRRRAQPVATRARLAKFNKAAVNGTIASSFNFYKRQADINDRAIMSDVLLETSHEVAADQAAQQQRDRERAAVREFDALTENMHHLVGTKTTPGIYSSAFGAEHARTAFGHPMEDHIKASFANRQARLRLSASISSKASPPTRSIKVIASHIEYKEDEKESQAQGQHRGSSRTQPISNKRTSGGNDSKRSLPLLPTATTPSSSTAAINPSPNTHQRSIPANARVYNPATTNISKSSSSLSASSSSSTLPVIAKQPRR